MKETDIMMKETDIMGAECCFNDRFRERQMSHRW